MLQRPSHPPPSKRLSEVLGGALLLAAIACGPQQAKLPPHDGPIVLITLDALRADVLGAFGGPPGMTPHFDALAAEATWAGRAVATSSWTVPSMASVMTGQQPFRHGNWHGDRSVLADEHLTLAEALSSLGYRTAAYRSNHWLDRKYGYAQGFDTFRYIGNGRRAERALEGLDGGRGFVWLHILPPHAPYVRRDPLLERLPEDLVADRSALPKKVRPLDLEPYYDPAVALPAAEHDTFWAMYLCNVAWADRQLGRYLDALRRSGHWDDAIVVVTSDHGEEFGEYGQVVHGGSLGRVLIEVPLVIKGPAGGDWSERLVGVDSLPSTARIFPTLVAAAGGASLIGEDHGDLLPVLLDPAAERPALSELYLGNGTNQFSWVDGKTRSQLLWTSHFGPGESAYFAARRASLGGEPTGDETPEALFGRQRDRFDRTPPLAGSRDRQPDLLLLRWTEDGSVAYEELSTERQMAAALRDAWLEANGREMPPRERGTVAQPSLSDEEIERLKALGYVGG